MTLRLRLAGVEDAVELAEFGANAFARAFGPENDPADMQDYLDRSFSVQEIGRLLRSDAAKFLLAERSGRLVGYAMLRKGGDPDRVGGPSPVELVRIYAHPDEKGSGIGSALMRRALQLAKDSSQETIWLGVWRKNRDAIRFYRKWGFQAIGTQEFVLGEDVQQDLVMSRPVDHQD